MAANLPKLSKVSRPTARLKDQAAVISRTIRSRGYSGVLAPTLNLFASQWPMVPCRPSSEAEPSPTLATWPHRSRWSRQRTGSAAWLASNSSARMRSWWFKAVAKASIRTKSRLLRASKSSFSSRSASTTTSSQASASESYLTRQSSMHRRDSSDHPPLKVHSSSDLHLNIWRV